MPGSSGPSTQPPDRGDRAYLEFVGGSAAKFYAAVIENDDAGSWRVSFNFGRIGFPRPWASKVDGVDEPGARRVLMDLVGEKTRKGYEHRPWPAYLALPDGQRADDASGSTEAVRGIYLARRPGELAAGMSVVGGVTLPAGHLLSAQGEGGSRGTGPVLWVTDAPVPDLPGRLATLARGFTESGLWPLAIDPRFGIDRLDEVLMDIPRSTGADPFQLLRRWWHANIGVDEDEFDEETMSPFGKAFPGLAARSSEPRPLSIDGLVPDLDGHLGLVAVDRPARVPDAIGWMGPANYDLNPTEQSAILETWEDRFDAYLIGLGFDVLTFAVGRPPRDLDAATAIAAEHFAFSPDNIWQGVGSISEYAEMLVDADRWDFWWD